MSTSSRRLQRAPDKVAHALQNQTMLRDSNWAMSLPPPRKPSSAPPAGQLVRLDAALLYRSHSTLGTPAFPPPTGTPVLPPRPLAAQCVAVSSDPSTSGASTVVATKRTPRASTALASPALTRLGALALALLTLALQRLVLVEQRAHTFFDSCGATRKTKSSDTAPCGSDTFRPFPPPRSGYPGRHRRLCADEEWANFSVLDVRAAARPFEKSSIATAEPPRRRISRRRAPWLRWRAPPYRKVGGGDRDVADFATSLTIRRSRPLFRLTG